MTNQLLDNLEKDIQLLIQDKFHTKHIDLMNICIAEDVIELIKLARNLNEELKTMNEPVNGMYMTGYKHCLQDLSRRLKL